MNQIEETGASIMKKYNRVILSILAVLSLGFLSACSDDEEVVVVDPGTGIWIKISTGGNHHYAGIEDPGAHTCGIQSDNTLWCWGSNAHGQLGIGSYASSGVTQVGVETDWIDIAAVGSRTCGIRGADGKGTLWCWGFNDRSRGPDYGAPTVGLLGLGDEYGTELAINTPTQVGTADDWTQLGLSNHSGCGIRDDGTDQTLWCWGSNSQGALANGVEGNDTFVNEPRQENGEYTDWIAVFGSRQGYESNNQCGIRKDGDDQTLWCWGNDTGFIGGTQTTPTQESGMDTDWAEFSMTGYENACAIKTDGTLFCQGYEHGSEGDGNYSNDGFNQLGSDDDWEKVSMGLGHVSAIKNGALYSWGRNHIGELGIGAEADVNHATECDTDQHDTNTGFIDCHTPVLVDDSMTWTDVSVGRWYGCAIEEEGDLYCWGQNTFGQTGVSNQSNILYNPMQVQ